VTGAHTSRDEAILGAVAHLADLALDGTSERLAEVLAWIDGYAGADVIQVVRLARTHLERELKLKSAFLAEYNYRRAEGHSDAEAHRMALEAGRTAAA
jgi:uncharacterized membrane protein YccC